MKHQTISFVKSGLRLLGYAIVSAAAWEGVTIEWVLTTWFTGWGLIALAEVVGIWEEFGQE
jgi:hypothetical protein